MNKVILIGRMTKDAELKFTPGNGTAVATTTLAVDKRGKDGQREADFIPIVVWNKAAENLANYTSKGSLIGVAGRISTRSYEAKDGTRRYITEVVCDEVQFLDKKATNTPSGIANNENNEEMQPVDDNDIPFN